ncbi:hypothetical protein [Schaalia cardiffensis]|uniref:hypothetical protein n=1 Tax=Schaalia cardiffensis TaxID=181487 RepID=UPI0023F2DD51|nr:hypothetical protein [Schaalia cardiffensis]
MTTEGPVYVSVAVEGASDEGMAHALVRYVGFTLAKPLLSKNGKSKLDPLIGKLARTGVYNPWIVFRDADSDCPVALREELIGAREHDGAFELRIAQSMTEAWLMADTEGFARYFSISKDRMSAAPDRLEHAKRKLLQLLLKSRSRKIRGDMLWQQQAKEGDLYVNRLNDFAQNHWDIDNARRISPSLDRTVSRLQQMRCILSQA